MLSNVLHVEFGHDGPEHSGAVDVGVAEVGSRAICGFVVHLRIDHSLQHIVNFAQTPIFSFN